MIALRLRQQTLALAAGGLAIGAALALVAHVSLAGAATSGGLEFGLALTLAALTGIAKTTTA